MFKQGIIAVAAAVALSSGVAIAKETPQPAGAEEQAPAVSAKTRYCMKSQPVTGSMLQARSCKTLEQWKALGVDPTAKKR